MRHVYFVLSWASGVIFIAVGLITIVVSPLAGLALLVAALFLLPPSRDYGYLLTKITLTPVGRSVVIISLLVSFSILLNLSIERERAQLISQEEADRLRKDQQIRDENVAFFNANRERIIAEAQSALTNSDFQLAIDACSKYLASGDSRLADINRLATERLRIIKEAERLAKEEKERRAIISGLLVKLSELSESDVKQLRDIYRELTKRVPGNAEYRARFEFYSKKNVEIEKQQERARKEQEAKAEIDKQNIVVRAIEERLQDNAEAIRKYYANADQIKNGSADINQLAIILEKYENISDRQAIELSGKARKLQSRVSQQVRQMYASSVESIFMKSGIDAEVSVSGSEMRQLKISYALMSKPLAYKFENEMMIGEQARSLGFSSIIYTNGFDGALGKAWAVELSKK